MAIECMAPIIEARRGPWKKADFTVLLMLANYAWPDGSNIFPSVPVLALACRLKERQVQSSIQALLSDKVLILVKRANESGFGGRRTNEYRLDMARVQKMQGCKICGGPRCKDKGCPEESHPRKKQQGTRAKSAGDPRKKLRPYIDGPVKEPSLNSRRASPRAPDRRGDPAVWAALDAGGLSTEAETKLCSFEGVPALDGDHLVVDFPKDWHERHVMPFRRQVAAAIKRPVVFRFAGRVAQ